MGNLPFNSMVLAMDYRPGHRGLRWRYGICPRCETWSRCGHPIRSFTCEIRMQPPRMAARNGQDSTPRDISSLG